MRASFKARMCQNSMQKKRDATLWNTPNDHRWAKVLQRKNRDNTIKIENITFPKSVEKDLWLRLGDPNKNVVLITTFNKTSLLMMFYTIVENCYRVWPACVLNNIRFKNFKPYSWKVQCNIRRLAECRRREENKSSFICRCIVHW